MTIKSINGSTNTLLSRVPNPVQAHIFSFLEQGEILTNVNRINKRAREIVIGTNLSSPSRQLEHCASLVLRKIAKVSEANIVQRLSRFPHLTQFLKAPPFKDTQDETPLLFISRWQSALEAAEDLRVSEKVSEKGYALFCEAHPYIPDAYDVANIPRFMCDDPSFIPIDPRYFNIAEYEQVQQTVERWEKFIATTDLVKAPEHLKSYARDVYNHGIRQASIYVWEIRTIKCFIGKWAVLLNQFISALENPKIEQSIKNQVIQNLDGNVCTGRILRPLIDAYDFLVNNSHLLEHTLFRALKERLPLSEKLQPAALILCVQDIFEEYRLLPTILSYLERNSDRFPAEDLALFFTDQRNPQLNTGGVVLVLRLMGLLVSNNISSLTESTDKKDKT